MTIEEFTGFPAEGMQFMADLADNNNREWFNEHKPLFQEKVLRPAQSFVVALGERLQAVSPGVRYDTRTNGAGSLTRIYRDTRFSKDKTPYKTWLGMAFWQGDGKKNVSPGYYFGFDPSGGGVHVGMYGFDKEMLSQYRQAVDDEASGTALEAALSAVRASGPYEVSGAHYKRVPRGYDNEHPREELLRHNALYASSPRIALAEMGTPALVDIVLQHCKNLAPLEEWLVKVRQAA